MSNFEIFDAPTTFYIIAVIHLNDNKTEVSVMIGYNSAKRQ